MLDQKTGVFHRYIARYLFHPLLIRMTGDSRYIYPPAFQMNEKQNVVGHQTSERQHFHREKVGRRQDRLVRTDKIFPTRCLLPVWEPAEYHGAGEYWPQFDPTI